MSHHKSWMTEERKNKARAKKSYFVMWHAGDRVRMWPSWSQCTLLFLQMNTCSKIRCYFTCAHRLKIVLGTWQWPQFSSCCSCTRHISAKQSTFGTMWNGSIAAWMHHYGVSMDQFSLRNVYSTLFNPCSHEMAKEAPTVLYVEYTIQSLILDT